MEVEDYSDRALAIFGATEAWEDDLKALNARKNRNLGGRPGFVISKKHETALMNFVTQANNGTIQPGTLAPPAPSGGRLRKSPPLAPSDALERLRLTAATMGMPLPSPAVSTSDATQGGPARISKRRSDGPRPVRALPSRDTTLTCPTLFVAADGLSYQVAIYTVPLPSLGQRVTLEVGETSLNYTVTLIENPTPPFDTILITQADGEPDQPLGISRAGLVGGRWQILGLQDAHQLQFHPPSS